MAAGDPSNQKGMILGVGTTDSYQTGRCQGVGIIFSENTPGYSSLPTVTTGTATPLGSIPYHVPQVCVTPTGTCVGPFDGTFTPAVPTPIVGGSPQVTPGTNDLCVVSFKYNYSYNEYEYDDPSECTTVPIIPPPSL